MTFKFIFTFPEVESIEDISMIVEINQIPNNILNLTIPALHKPLGQENFMGWEIEKVTGDLELIYADKILTKNNLIQFSIKSNQEYYETTIYCKMKWKLAIVLSCEWGDFDTFVHLAIDTSNPNPETCCTYIGTSLDYNDWDKFFGHYPVLLKDGIETVKLNPNNYNEDINGNNVDIESGNFGDVMIAFPRRGLRISKDDGIITISFTTAQNDDRYQYYAHTHNKRLDKFYIGAYNGFIDDNGRLRSLSNKIPTTNKGYEDFRQAAQLNGSGYEQFAFYQLVYLQAMFVMKYKTLDGQAILGIGKDYVDQLALPEEPTGALNTKGLDYGNSFSIPGDGVKFAGIENFWGYIGNLVDGILTFNHDEKGAIIEIYTTTNQFDDYANYTLCYVTDLTMGFMADCIGTSEGGFILTKPQDSSISDKIRASSYFCSFAGTASQDKGVTTTQNNCFGSLQYLYDSIPGYKAIGLFSLSLNLTSSNPPGKKNVGARLQKL